MNNLRQSVSGKDIKLQGHVRKPAMPFHQTHNLSSQVFDQNRYISIVFFEVKEPAGKGGPLPHGWPAHAASAQEINLAQYTSPGQCAMGLGDD